MKKISLFFVLCMMALPLWVVAQGLKGDVNDDDTINIHDLTTLIHYLLTDDPAGVYLENADVYEDGKINIVDVTSLINILLTTLDEPVEHEWVDLGLPSGTMWATCNVGASSPYECGDYFAWGETNPKEYYAWSTYIWCKNGDYEMLTKYCTSSDYGYHGFVDNKTELDLEDDAAWVNWGASWRIPTVDQLLELSSKCSWTWTHTNDVNGYLVIGPNGNSLFLRTTGYYSSSGMFWNPGLEGAYWSRTLISSHTTTPYSLFFNDINKSYSWSYFGRPCGCNVRAVLK